MQLTFLEATVPLTKSYEKRSDGTFKGGAYPGVTNFTSKVEDVETIAQFAEALEKHASVGHCLLTSSLQRPIKEESRAGLSNKNERREWILLDIDGLKDITSAEEFVHKVLPPPFHKASYIVQYSPSHGIKDGVRCHLYFMLSDLTDTRAIEGWLVETNLTHPELSNQVTLSKSNLALSYPLDRVASRNGRIVYITSPECVGFEDPVDKRITCVTKDHDRVSFNFMSRTPAEISRMVRDRVNDLRRAAGLRISRKSEHVRVRPDGTEILDDSLVEHGIITSWQEDNDRFMRCNIGGGDSYAYYYHRDQEDPYLHNFKGEPSFRLRLFDPQFFADQVQPHFIEIQKTRPRPFVFRDASTDKWFMGSRVDKVIQEQPSPVGSVLKIEHYFAEFGTSPPAVIQSWDRKFDPTYFDQWNEDEKVFNTWRPTEYQQNTLYRSTIPPLIEKVIRHVTGGDEESFDSFINWLAFVQQNREKTGTAWVLHGVPGTGKGLLFHSIITPIFGRDYCVSKQFRDLTDNFNGWMEQCLFLNIDEANSDDMGKIGKSLVNNLKNWITEPSISVRHMQATSKMCNSYMSFIFTTNDFGVIPIQEGDRRINVAPRQEEKLEITEEEVAAIEHELAGFSAYLTHYEVDAHRVRMPLENKAKQDLQEAARSSIEEFFHAARTGDLEFFVDGTHEETTEYSALAEFKKSVGQWMEDAKNDRPSKVTLFDLKAAHVVMCRDKGMKSSAFKSMSAKRGFPMKQCRNGDDRWRGWFIEWKLTDEQKRDLKLHLRAIPSDAEIEQKIKSEISGNPE